MRLDLDCTKVLTEKSIYEVRTLVSNGAGYAVLHNTGIEQCGPSARDKFLLNFAKKFGVPTQHSESKDYIWSVSSLRGTHKHDEPLPSDEQENVHITLIPVLRNSLKSILCFTSFVVPMMVVHLL